MRHCYLALQDDNADRQNEKIFGSGMRLNFFGRNVRVRRVCAICKWWSRWAVNVRSSKWSGGPNLCCVTRCSAIFVFLTRMLCFSALPRPFYCLWFRIVSTIVRLSNMFTISRNATCFLRRCHHPFNTIPPSSCWHWSPLFHLVRWNHLPLLPFIRMRII